MTAIIGFTGRARSGKDTAASFVCDMFGFEPVSFAEPIKQAVTAMFGLDERHLDGELKETPLEGLGRSPRYLFQTLGTEWGRELVHPDVWIYAMNTWVKRLEREYLRQGLRLQGVVVSDVRFENEAAWVRDRGGLLIHLERQKTVDVLWHVSEAGIQRHDGDIVIRNDGTPDELYQKLEDVVMAFLEES